MKIIFLDFDGVINPISFHHGSGFSKTACANIQDILTKDPKVRIVISSAWRRNGLETCQKILKENGIDSMKVVGLTTADGGWAPENREEQIHKWLKEHKEVTNYVVLDDYPLAGFGNKYIKTNSYVGLTQKDADRVEEILCK